MYIADTLSRAYLKEMLPSEEVKSLELVDHIENLQVSPSRLAQVEEESARDPVCIDLRQVILQGWPSDICECKPVLRPFFQFRSGLIVLGAAFPDFASVCSGQEWHSNEGFRWPVRYLPYAP